MRIQELEKELNITRSNIRFYEKEGLISPPRKENGYREYTDDDIAQLKKIIIFRKLGIAVADIKDIFDFTIDDFKLMNSNALKSSFLKDEEKQELLKELC